MRSDKPTTKRRNTRAPRKDGQHLRRGRRFSKEQCNHCGGIFKLEMDGREVCLMCGRERKHLCNECMNVHKVRGAARSAKKE